MYRDDDVLVVNKPCGMPSQATRDASSGALDRLVTDELDPRARLLHRIDRDASGLVLFTRSEPARSRFAALLRSHALERTYCALVWGRWQPERGELAGTIGRDPRDRRRMAVGSGQPAVTRFRLICHGATQRGAPVSQLELDLVTGRTHQIRVHLAHAGHPICGDGLYGSEGVGHQVDRLFLHAHRLAWPGAAPVVAPLPPAFAYLIG
jgi:23S rRNA pseudouridine1911/1915/1917 synthase